MVGGSTLVRALRSLMSRDRNGVGSPAADQGTVTIPTTGLASEAWEASPSKAASPLLNVRPLLCGADSHGVAEVLTHFLG